MAEATKELCEARAESCEKIAGLNSAKIELRKRFAYKASSFRIMAKLAALDEVRLNEYEASLFKKIHGLAEIRRKPHGARSWFAGIGAFIFRARDLRMKEGADRIRRPSHG